jgi:hypothetical protein
MSTVKKCPPKRINSKSGASLGGLWTTDLVPVAAHKMASDERLGSSLKEIRRPLRTSAHSPLDCQVRCRTIDDQAFLVPP